MVQKFMTPLPYTIRCEDSLAVAHTLMRKHDIRHLPVLKDGRLIFTTTDALSTLNGVLNAVLHMPERAISRD